MFVIPNNPPSYPLKKPYINPSKPNFRDKGKYVSGYKGWFELRKIENYYLTYKIIPL